MQGLVIWDFHPLLQGTSVKWSRQDLEGGKQLFLHLPTSTAGSSFLLPHLVKSASSVSPWRRDSSWLRSLLVLEELSVFYLRLSGPRWNWLTKTAPGRGCGWQSRHFADTGSSSCGGGRQVLPAAVLPTAVILSDIVSEAGAAWVRSWIVGLKGRGGAEKRWVTEAGFAVGISILAVHITKDSDLVIWHMCHCLFPEYMQIFWAHSCRVCHCHSKQQNKIKRIGQPPPYQLLNVFVF